MLTIMMHQTVKEKQIQSKPAGRDAVLHVRQDMLF